MKITKEDIFAELGLLIILAMSLTALLIVYHHYRHDFQWAKPLNNIELHAGQVRYWQYDTLHSVKQLHENSRRPSRRLSEFEHGRYITSSRINETWALVQKDDTLYVVQRFPSTNIPYGTPLQRFIDTFIESEQAKYWVKPITPAQRSWLEQQRADYPALSVQQDIVLQRLLYSRTTVLISVLFILMACFGLALTISYYACLLRNLVSWAYHLVSTPNKANSSQQNEPKRKTAKKSVVLAVENQPAASLARSEPCQQQPKTIVIFATLILLGYWLVLQVG